MFLREQLENRWTDELIKICKRKSSFQKQMAQSSPAQPPPRRAPIPSSKNLKLKKRLKRWKVQFQKSASSKPRIHRATKQTMSVWRSLHKFTVSSSKFELHSSILNPFESLLNCTKPKKNYHKTNHFQKILQKIKKKATWKFFCFLYYLGSKCRKYIKKLQWKFTSST